MNAKILATCILLACSIASAVAPAQSRYFTLQKRSGVWWFVDPSGKLMISAGVDQMSYRPDVIRGTRTDPYLENVSKIYPNETAWAVAALARLRRWDFNTIGAWSDADLWSRGTPYTVILNIAGHAGADWQRGIPVDVYDPKFQKTATEIANRECGPRVNDPDLLGYFSDNELRWGPDWRGKQNMLAMYLALPSSAPGHQHAVKFLKKKYAGKISNLNRAWNVHAPSFNRLPTQAATGAYQGDSLDFLSQMAERYFEVCARAIHQADPHHLYLGARIAGNPPDPVFRAARRADAVSINIYRFDPRSLVEHVYELTQKPVLITEFAFRAENSGLPNTQGAGPKAPDQAARAKAYRDYVTWLEGLPEAVGYHWFKWCDEPKQGRFDGENSNYGLVNIKDKPYREFIEAVKTANQEAVKVHENSAKAAADERTRNAAPPQDGR
ncbi:MAG TPA: beta-agarase [Terriglobia bacterium]|nr:beta-agarase [Terriglobia bacterium]